MGKNRILSVNPESREIQWEVKDSLAQDLTTSVDGEFLVEINTFAPVFSVRDIKNGEILRQFGLDTDCRGGGQIILRKDGGDTFLSVNWLDMVGLYSNNTVIIQEWDLENEECGKLIQYQGNFDLFDIQSDGSKLVYGGVGRENEVVVYDLLTQSELCRGPSADYRQVCSPTGLLVIFKDGKMIFLDSQSCQVLREFIIKTSGTNLAFSDDGKMFAAANDGIHIYDTGSGELLAEILLAEDVSVYDQKLFHTGLAFSPDGHYLLMALSTGAYTGKVQLWQVEF